MSFNQFNIDEYVRLLMQLQQQPASQQNIINRQAAAPSMDSFQNFVRSHDDLQLPQPFNNGIQSASFVHAANANSNQLAAAGNISAQNLHPCKLYHPIIQLWLLSGQTKLGCQHHSVSILSTNPVLIRRHTKILPWLR